MVWAKHETLFPSIGNRNSPGLPWKFLLCAEIRRIYSVFWADRLSQQAISNTQCTTCIFQRQFLLLYVKVWENIHVEKTPLNHQALFLKNHKRKWQKNPPRGIKCTMRRIYSTVIRKASNKVTALEWKWCSRDFEGFSFFCTLLFSWFRN